MKHLTVLFVLVFSATGAAYADGGADCATAPTINIPADLPYTDSGTTCGKLNTYDDACSSSYGGGEDAIYALNVTVAGDYAIALSGTGSWTAFFVSDGCPDTSPTCTGSAASSSGNPSGTVSFPAAGTYYLHIDTWPSPNCTAFTLDIDAPFQFDYTVDDTCATIFDDISATGTGLALTDDGEAAIQVPFDFGFYGTIYSAPFDVQVGNNGAVILNDNSSQVGTGAAMPSSGLGLGVAPFWDDLDDETGDVYWEVKGTSPNRQLIVQWDNRPHYNGIGDATFQAVFDEATSVITFVYEDVDFGDALYDFGVSATVGIQDAGNSIADEYSYNTASLSDGMCISFTPEYVPVELMSFSIE
jgi:hypothetical protein